MRSRTIVVSYELFGSTDDRRFKAEVKGYPFDLLPHDARLFLPRPGNLFDAEFSSDLLGAQPALAVRSGARAVEDFVELGVVRQRERFRIVPIDLDEDKGPTVWLSQQDGLGCGLIKQLAGRR